MGLLNSFIKKVALSKKEPEYREKTFCVVGVRYYLDNLQKLSCADPNYRKSSKTLISDGVVSKRIYQYTYINKPVKLIPEPHNPHDKNAVAVHIAGELVGYISADEAPEVRSILASDVKFVSSFISGGKYKVVHPDGTVEKQDGEIHINIKIGYSS